MADITQCPSCRRKLQVPETLIGYDVQCPSCGATFTARVAGQPEMQSRGAADREAPGEYERTPPRYGGDERAAVDDYGRYAPRRGQAPHRGTMILVFGILGIALCGIFGIVAIAMANADLAEIRAGRMDPEGESLANTGRILGIISLVLNLACCGLTFLAALADANGL